MNRKLFAFNLIITVVGFVGAVHAQVVPVEAKSCLNNKMYVDHDGAVGACQEGYWCFETRNGRATCGRAISVHDESYNTAYHYIPRQQNHQREDPAIGESEIKTLLAVKVSNASRLDEANNNSTWNLDTTNVTTGFRSFEAKVSRERKFARVWQQPNVCTEGITTTVVPPGGQPTGNTVELNQCPSYSMETFANQELELYRASTSCTVDGDNEGRPTIERLVEKWILRQKFEIECHWNEPDQPEITYKIIYNLKKEGRGRPPEREPFVP